MSEKRKMRNWLLLDYYLIITEEVVIEELVLRNKPKNSDIRPAYIGNSTAYFCRFDWKLADEWMGNANRIMSINHVLL